MNASLSALLLLLDASRCNNADGLDVPIPTFPALSTMNLVPVEEPTANAGPVMPFGFIESWAHGLVVPTPILPLSKILNVGESEEFAVWNVTVVPDVKPVTASLANGVVVPTPTLFWKETFVVPVGTYIMPAPLAPNSA